MAVDTDPSLTEATADLGTDTATQDGALDATTAADTGTDQATPADATMEASSTTDTRSDPKDLLKEAAQSVFRQNPAPESAAQVQAVQPNAIPPELQAFLKDPEGVKRLQGLVSLQGRQAAQLGQYQKELQAYQGLPPADQLREQYARQQKEAQAANLKPWNPGHPDVARTNSRLNRAKAFMGAFEVATPEQQADPNYRAQLAQKLGGVRKEDLDLLEEKKQSQQEFHEKFHDDPQGVLQEFVSQQVAAGIARFEEFQNQRVQVQQFMGNNQELLSKHSDAVQWAMENPARREVGMRLATLEEENQKLREKLAAESEVVETAKVQAGYAKQRATVKRDAATVGELTMDAVLKRADEGKLSEADLLKQLRKARAY